MALEHGYEEHVARAYANLATTWSYAQRPQATGYLQDGMAYCAEHDLDSGAISCGRSGACASRSRRLAGAEEDATAILSVPWTSVANRVPALLVLGLVRARRGDPGVRAALDEARDLALATGEMQYIAPMAAARAEWRWLQGDVRAARRGGSGLSARASPRTVHGTGRGGDLALAWRWPDRSARREHPRPSPWRWRATGARRRRPGSDGCPYEQALALLDGDEAGPADGAGHLRASGRGARGGDRAPAAARGGRAWPATRTHAPATRANPQGLTNRQLEILLLLAEGLRNPRSPSGSRPPPGRWSITSPPCWRSSRRARGPRRCASPIS